jgi:ubiquinone/menaquinone biosynthesis C-methylase UbiE
MKDQSKQIELNKAKWDRWAENFDAKSWRREFLRNGQRSVISLVDIRPGMHFLDVGCGTGWAVGEVARLAGGKGEFYGVDLSPKMIEKAEENFRGRSEMHFLQANVESIPLEGDFFDAMICTNSFHHYPRPERALVEMQRLLKPGGKLFILDPTADSWVSKLADKMIPRIEPEHVKMYSTKEFEQMFQNAGLVDVTSRAIREKSNRIHVGEKRA